jgi:hypothetical protein
MDIVEIENSQVALAALQEKQFNIILISNRINDISLADFQTAKTGTRTNSQTPIIVLAENDDHGLHEENDLKDFNHVVQMRARPAELINKINFLSNPRDMRKEDRYYIPNAKVSVNGAGMETDAKLINLSRGGILVELLTYVPELLMKNDISLTLNVSADLHQFNIPMLKGKLLRLHVTNWHPDNTPVAMRASFVFVDLDEEVRNILETLLELAKNDQWQIADYIA